MQLVMCISHDALTCSLHAKQEKRKRKKIPRHNIPVRDPSSIILTFTLPSERTSPVSAFTKLIGTLGVGTMGVAILWGVSDRMRGW
jgi:hypothetical protein